MSSEGPTTVGSINARLTLNADDFERGMTRAGEQADRLDGRDIHVDAHADTTGAVAQLEALDAAERRATESSKGQFTAMQALITASPLLLGATSTLAAATVGLGTAFVGMGVAGGLAIKGIKDEMAGGTSVGNAYAAGLQSLKGDLDQLATTAAVRMLDSFDQTVGTINAHMPTLNRLTGEMGSALGQIGNGVLSAVLTGLERMSPLIEAGAVELSKFIGWLDSFASSQGFADFVSYAVSNLPMVTTLLENVVTLAGHLLAAFAPVGPVVVSALNLLIGALNAMPLPVLAGLATGGLAVYAAFKLIGSEAIVGGIMKAAGAIGITATATQLAIPVVGVLVAALGAFTIASTVAATSQQALTQAASDYADAVQKDNDKIGENVRLKAAQKLVEDGVAQAAERQGISMSQLLDATLKTGPGLGAFNDRLATMKDRISGSNVRDHSKDLQQLKSDYDILTKGVDGNNAAINDAIEKARLLGQVQDGAGTAAQQAAAKSAEMQKALDGIGLSTQGAITQLDKFIADLEAAGLAQISADQAAINYHSSIDALTASVTKNGTSLDLNTAAGRANVGAFDAIAKSGLDAAGAMAKNGDSVQAVRGQLDNTYGSLINAAAQFGITGDQADGMARKVLGIPPNVTVQAWMQDHASAALDAVAGKAHSIDGTTVNIFTVEHLQTLDERSSTNDPAGVSRMGHYAYGGHVAYLAGGGVDPLARGTDTVRAMLTPGEFVVNASAASKVGGSVLEHINRTGQLPPQQQAPSGPFQISGNLYLDSGEFLGKVHGVARSVAQDEIGHAVREAAYLRPGVG